MRSPSSLIFLVLLGVWAAYFVQYWIRRRDHLATARSVEQFSAAMRVLERRTAIPRTDLSDPAPRSWSVHPARATRPQVVVKRAVGAEGVVPRGSAPHPSADPVRPVRRPADRPAPVRPSRPVRAAVLLVTFLGSLVAGALAGFGLAAPWVPAVLAGAVVLAFLWVRSGVKAEQAATAARRRRAAAAARRRASAAPVPVEHRRREVREPAAAEHVEVAAAPAAAQTEVASAERPASDPLAVALATETADETLTADTVVEASAEPQPEPELELEYVHLVDEDDIPLTWEPVPVPRPTYTMKAKAERAEVPPAETTPDPAPVSLRSREDELDERRVAGA